MTNRQFYKIIYQVTVLADDTLSDNYTLNDIGFLINNGKCSGVTKQISHKTLDGKQIAEELQKQGSDPGFFQVDKNGNDLEQ